MMTDMKVINAVTQTCPQGWEALFFVEWEGTDKGCVYQGQLITYNEWKARVGSDKKKQRKNPCKQIINAIKAKNQTNFEGRNICVQRNGPRMADLPELLNGKCPSGYKLCSDKVKAANDKVCVLNNLHPATCPINEINFFKTNGVKDKMPTTGWTGLAWTPGTNGLTFGFTK